MYVDMAVSYLLFVLRHKSVDSKDSLVAGGGDVVCGAEDERLCLHHRVQPGPHQAEAQPQQQHVQQLH